MVVLLVFSQYVEVNYGDSNPREPNIASGRVHALNVHGTVVFLNDDEERIEFWSFYGGLISGFLGGLLWKLAHRELNKKTG